MTCLTQSFMCWSLEGQGGCSNWTHMLIHFFGSPFMSQAYCSPQSRAPQRASTNLQLKVLLPILLFTTLCTRHIHCCNSGPDETFGGSFLHRKRELCDVATISQCLQGLHHRFLLDNFSKVLGAFCAWVDSREHVHLYPAHLDWPFLAKTKTTP